MSYTIGKTYVLANDTDYTPGIKGMVDTITVINQPTYLQPGPHLDVPTQSNLGPGKGLTVDITTIDGIVTGCINFVPGSGYTPGIHANVPTTNGTGTGLTLRITVDGLGNATNFQLDNPGINYLPGDIITILGADIPGGATPADNVTFQISAITSEIDTIVTNKYGKNYMAGLYSTVLIDSNDAVIDYTTIDGPVAITDSNILGFHVLVTNTADVIVTHANGNQSTFTTGSLMAGAIYPYSVIGVVLDPGDANSLLGTAPGIKTVMF